MRFAAIDFETADYYRDSACAVGIVRVEGGTIVARDYRLIRPPRPDFVFSYLHGITWEDVRSEPSFRTVWLEVRNLVEGTDWIVAHNVPFDKSVLETCCHVAQLRPPSIPYKCTMRLASERFRFPEANLPYVCNRLGIPLDHHDALSDAKAAALIVLEAERRGYLRSGTSRASV